MKISSVLIFLTLLVIGAVFAVSCGPAERFGASKLDKDVVTIGSILRAPAEYDGKTVKVEGRITRECPTGCWFDLEDDSGVIYVDLNPSAFAIPQKVGGKAAAQGKVKVKNGIATIVGEGVEIK